MLEAYETGVSALKQYWLGTTGRIDTGKSVALNELRRYFQYNPKRGKWVHEML